MNMQIIPLKKSVENPSLVPSRAVLAYHEIPSLRHETRDVLKQLDANVRLLEDLGGRLGASAIGLSLGNPHRHNSIIP